MTRLLFILAVLTPLTNAQTPLEVTGRISQIDPQLFSGWDAGAGLFMTVHNTSPKGIQGYVYETFFADPATGKILGLHRVHSSYQEPSKGAALPAGGVRESPKPYPVPTVPPGSTAQYSFKVDLVIFDDGGNWGPAHLKSSQRLLANLSHPK